MLGTDKAARDASGGDSYPSPSQEWGARGALELRTKCRRAEPSLAPHPPLFFPIKTEPLRLGAAAERWTHWPTPRKRTLCWGKCHMHTRAEEG